MDIHPRFRWLAELRWCGIPPVCRRCDVLRVCRGGFRTGFKCRDGCVMRKRKDAARRARDRADYLDHLIAYVEAEEGSQTAEKRRR